MESGHPFSFFSSSFSHTEPHWGPFIIAGEVPSLPPALMSFRYPPHTHTQTHTHLERADHIPEAHREEGGGLKGRGRQFIHGGEEKREVGGRGREDDEKEAKRKLVVTRVRREIKKMKG